MKSLCVSHASVGAAIVRAAPHPQSSEFSLERARHARQTALCFCSTEIHLHQLQVADKTSQTKRDHKSGRFSVALDNTFTFAVTPVAEKRGKPWAGRLRGCDLEV